MGSQQASIPSFGRDPAKTVYAGNFRLEIGDRLTSLPANRVTAVELPTITRDALGAVRISNFKVTVQYGPDVIAWADWYGKMVLEHAPDVEKTATLHALNPTLSADVFTVTMTGVGVVGYEESTGGTTATRKVTFELYCEGVSIAVMR